METSCRGCRLTLRDLRLGGSPVPGSDCLGSRWPQPPHTGDVFSGGLGAVLGNSVFSTSFWGQSCKAWGFRLSLDLGPRAPRDFIEAALLCRQTPRNAGVPELHSLETHSCLGLGSDDGAVTRQLEEACLCLPIPLSPGTQLWQPGGAGSTAHSIRQLPRHGSQSVLQPEPLSGSRSLHRGPHPMSILYPGLSLSSPRGQMESHLLSRSPQLQLSEGHLLPATSVLHMDTGSCPGHSISKPAPC